MLVQKLAVLLADEIFKPACQLLDPLGYGAGDFEAHLIGDLLLSQPLRPQFEDF